MTAKEKAAPLATGTAQKAALTQRNSTVPDLLQAWNNSVKPSRNRQQKSSWKRNQRGFFHLSFLELVCVIVLWALTVGVLNHG